MSRCHDYCRARARATSAFLGRASLVELEVMPRDNTLTFMLPSASMAAVAFKFICLYLSLERRRHFANAAHDLHDWPIERTLSFSSRST